MSFLCTHSPAGIFIFFCLCLLRYNIFLLLHTFECLLSLAISSKDSQFFSLL